MSELDKVFAGSIPKLYESLLVPLIFQPFATDLVARLESRPLSRVLEIAAGTGVVTREMAGRLPESVGIVATDLNPAMLDQARVIPINRAVEWRQADAMSLSFADASFDAVVCQFGVMFLPDRPAAFAEARRVLRAGGVFLFNAWDRLSENEFADTATTALARLFPESPPRFLERTPHGYHDPAVIERDLAAAGFDKTAQITVVTARSRAQSARVPAIAYCQGSPLRSEIDAIDAARLDEATSVVEQAIAQRFGPGPVDGKIQAFVVCVER